MPRRQSCEFPSESISTVSSVRDTGHNPCPTWIQRAEVHLGGEERQGLLGDKGHAREGPGDSPGQYVECG